MDYRTVAHIEEPSVARVLIAALKAHGFHPLEGPEHGLPGLAGVYGPKGIPIELRWKKPLTENCSPRRWPPTCADRTDRPPLNIATMDGTKGNIRVSERLSRRTHGAISRR